MKILFINDKGFKFGGSQEYLYYLKNKLIERGHIVNLIASSLSSNSKTFSDYKFKSINEKNVFRGFLRIFNISAFFRIRKLINEFQPDIIHINYIFNQVSPAIFLLLKNRTSVMTLHDEVMIQQRINSNLQYPTALHYFFEKTRSIIYLKLLKRVNHLIAPSEHIKKIYEKQGFSNIFIIPNGIPIKKSCEQIFNNKILFVGRLEKEKGIKYLILSMVQILKNIPSAELYVVGEGSQKNQLVDLAKKLNIKKEVKFSGKVNRETVEDYYRKCSLVVLPSIEESFGLVGIEAMSFGRPVIASKVGGIPDWLTDGEEGFLLNPRDPKQIADKVILLLSNKKLILRFGEKARLKSKQFDINKQIDKLMILYNERSK
jgi:glycosyltransferase involved in cell wall biosynthesis